MKSQDQDNKANYSRLDNALAHFLLEHCSFDESEQRAAFKKIVSELSASLTKGHSCIALSAKDKALVNASGLASERGNTPLIVEGSRLYLQRYWHYETRLADQIRYKVLTPPACCDNLDEVLDKHFKCDSEKHSASTEKDWQREAAKKAAQQSFSIITGGPGTGKTTTILKILAILQEIQLSISPAKTLNIALAAPTGKAAMRLQESMGGDKEKLNCSEEVKASITDSVSTIHRLLEAKPNSPYFRHDANNPLVHDVVVIDEASMVDLALMSKLVDALQPHARLILLGDKDQLASVESGSVLADLSQGLPHHTVALKKSWRFKEDIKQLAEAINQPVSAPLFTDMSSPSLAWQLLQSGQQSATALVTTALLPHIMKCSADYFQKVRDHHPVEVVFNAYKAFQILCSNRRGKWGVEGINDSIERSLQQQGVNTLATWYNGKPIIITRNDFASGLFNGDIGICLHDEGSMQRDDAQKDLLVYFQLADGRIKPLLPARLPQHETAYALTIHKSQGSEFEHVLMVLPEKPNPVLGKELIYTAVTRAKETVEVFSSEAVFDYALRHQVERISGLKDKVSQ